MTPAVAQQLVTADWPGLRTLYLDSVFALVSDVDKTELQAEATASSDDATKEACRHLAAGNWPQLSILDFDNNTIPSTGWAELAKGAWPRLKVLLAKNAFQCRDDPGLKEVSAACWPNLSQLELSNNDLDSHFHHLAQANWPNLVKLRMEGCTSLSTLPQAGQVWCTLRHLVSSNPDEEDVLGQLAAMLDSPGQALDSLQVAGCACGKTLVPAPSSWPTDSRLHIKVHICELVMQSLASGHWPIQAMMVSDHFGASVSSVEWSEGMRRLTQLDLSGMESFDLCSEWDLLVVCDDISQADWPALRSLSIMSDSLGDLHIKSVSSGKWSKLMNICVVGNKFTSLGIQHFADGNWPCLTTALLPPYIEEGMLQPVYDKWPGLQVYCNEDECVESELHVT